MYIVSVEKLDDVDDCNDMMIIIIIWVSRKNIN